MTGVTRRDGRVTGVTTEHGDIEAEYVVASTGMWGREFGRGRRRHPAPGARALLRDHRADPRPSPGLPTIKTAPDFAYVRNEGAGLMVGFFEPGSYPWASRGIPDDAEFASLPEDWDHLGPFYENMMKRLPVLAETGIRLYFSGPESFTPDGLYHLGEAPGLRNYFIAAGFNSVGFLTGPGAGAALADWIVDGHPPSTCPRPTPAGSPRTRPTGVFSSSASPRPWTSRTRSTGPTSSAPAPAGCAAARCTTGCRPPGRSSASCRAGSAPTGTPPRACKREYEYSFGRQNWFEHSAAEHRAVREAVGLFDTSSFGKLLVQGRDAEAVLQRVSAGNVAVEPGRIVYTQWLNAHGGIEADVTVTRLDETRFLVLSGPATLARDRDWLERHIGPDEFATVTDVSPALAMIPVMGPNARRLLQSLTDADLSAEAFPFGTSREIDLGCGFVRATRITYVGELGWELLIPADLAVHVYDTIADAGQEYGLRPAGYHALDSLRMEKAYRSWGHDISAGDTPLEAGLSFAVAWDKPGGFTGRDALLRQKERGVARRLVQFALRDPDAFAYHDEPVYRDGALAGRVSSAAYGHTLGRTVALGYVTAPEPGTPPSWYAAGEYEIEIAGERVPADASLRPRDDPASQRPRS